MRKVWTLWICALATAGCFSRSTISEISTTGEISVIEAQLLMLDMVLFGGLIVVLLLLGILGELRLIRRREEVRDDDG